MRDSGTALAVAAFSLSPLVSSVDRKALSMVLLIANSHLDPSSLITIVDEMGMLEQTLTAFSTHICKWHGTVVPKYTLICKQGSCAFALPLVHFLSIQSVAMTHTSLLVLLLHFD